MAAKQRRLSRREKQRVERDQEHMVSILNQNFGMRQINPLTPTQGDMFDSYKEGYNIAAIGTAGTKEQKEALYSVPYSDIVNDLFGRGDAYQILQQKGMIKFMTSSFVRGLTFDNAIIIVDECQSMTYHELDTIITRVGESSKIVFCGDTNQNDLSISRNRADISGLAQFLRVIRRINSFTTVQFTPDDIVRSGLVKEYILAKERLLAAA